MTNVSPEQIELFDAFMKILENRKPITQQMALELAMAWYAARADDKSDVVIDAMARHAKQMIGMVRGRR